MNIYVGNLSYTLTEEELRDIFVEFGEVNSASIIKDRFSGQSKGFGFVEMPDASEAESAIEGLDGKVLKGRNMKVNQAKPRRNRQ